MLMKKRSIYKPVRAQAGAGMIEVMIAVLLVAFGLLGAAGMHVRSIEFTVDTERRQMASTVASDLLETMRADAVTILDPKWAPKTDMGGYQKAAGTALPSVSDSDCQPLGSTAATRMGCWGLRAKKLMPELTDDLLTQHFAVSSSNGVVSVTVAWPVKKGQCLKAEAGAQDDEFCTYTLQSRL